MAGDTARKPRGSHGAHTELPGGESTGEATSGYEGQAASGHAARLVAMVTAHPWWRAMI